MTATVPFTPSTIAYDPPAQYILTIVPAPGSILDVVTKQFPNTASLIYKASQQKLYTTDNMVTLVISKSFTYNPHILTSRAIDICRSITVNRKLNFSALRYSPLFILRTLANPVNLLISTIDNITYINDNPVLYSIECTNGIIYVVP